MRNILSGLLVAWAVLGGPVLCIGGGIAHPCACERDLDARCSHESGCEDDPCGVDRFADAGPASDVLERLTAFLTAPRRLDGYVPRTTTVRCVLPPLLGDAPDLSHPPGTLPLRL